ncbi:MAG TPA: hypothetical protein VLL51_03245, partial [Gemmatimonadales bacterium]|nr:hypothetical protein [Gemmatimonadales bacterium]
YDRDRDLVSPAYNPARHAGVMMSLYQVAGSHDPAALAAADAGLGYVLERLVEGPGFVAFRPRGEDVPLGANSLLLAALVLRRDLTGDAVHDDLMRGLASFVVGQQLPDGNMLAYWSPATGAPIPEATGKFATGEAAWALALFDAQFPGEGWAEAAARTVDYLNRHRDRDEGRISRLPDHWAAYAVEALPAPLRTDERIDYARQLAGYFGIRLRFESQRTGEGINLLTRWYPGPPAGVGTAGEGIGALWRLSLADDRLADLRPNIEARLVCTAGLMVERQVTEAQAAGAARPALQEGAWFYRGYTQMDDQQHVISALLAALPILEGRTR